MLNVAGFILAVGSIFLYWDLQKGYEGMRPFGLQLGCGLIMIAGVLIGISG